MLEVAAFPWPPQSPDLLSPGSYKQNCVRQGYNVKINDIVEPVAVDVLTQYGKNWFTDQTCT